MWPKWRTKSVCKCRNNSEDFNQETLIGHRPTLQRPTAIKPCVCKPAGLPDADVDATANNEGASPRRINYWRLWLFDAVLVSVGALFFLTTRNGTCEFFGKAFAMALLPFIPVMVLVGGSGSTVFALTKVLIEKRSFNFPTAMVLLVAPALVVTLLLVLLSADSSSGHRLAYICLGKAPASASHVQVAGYSTFLREEWLGVFHAGQKDFQTMVTRAELVPVDDFEFRKMVESSALKNTGLYQSLPQLDNALCFKRVFKEGEEHERGSVYAAFDPATSTAVVFREYQD